MELRRAAKQFARLDSDEERGIGADVVVAAAIVSGRRRLPPVTAAATPAAADTTVCDDHRLPLVNLYERRDGMVDEKTGEIIIATKLEVAPNLQSLYRYLIDNKFIVEITDFNPDYLRIFPPDALAKLQSGDTGWEAMVPPEVKRIIKEREFFGYRAPKAA